MNKHSLIKLALIRYALLPRQLLGFDEGYCKDSHEFNVYFSSQAETTASLTATYEFLAHLGTDIENIGYQEKCQLILSFVGRLPFLDRSSFVSLDDYNPFDDFDCEDVNDYLIGKHIPAGFESEEDEASIFYADSPDDYYRWYNQLEDKSLTGLLYVYASLIKEL